MTYKEFNDWCNQRACDGCWGMNTAIYCIGVCETINNLPFWKRNKVWKSEYEDEIINNIITPIENKMKEVGLI